MRLSSIEIHARVSWPAVLERLGIGTEFLRNKHGPCPSCGGKDRFRFDNRRGHGDYFCNGCGPGDGFGLLQKVLGYTFVEARERVLEAAGITAEIHTVATSRTPPPAPPLARPSGRVWRILRSSCPVADCPDAVAYLKSRKLWPLPAGCTLRAHAGVDYFDEGRVVGRYPALIEVVTDIDGEILTAHLTYLANGRKLSDYQPRKLLSPLTGHEGCAVRLMRADDTLGVGEGIESCLAAAILHRLPVWAALNTALLARFEPPPSVLRLRVYGDRDAAGLAAADHLAQRLQGRPMHVELTPPTAPAKDWNDVQHQH